MTSQTTSRANDQKAARPKASQSKKVFQSIDGDFRGSLPLSERKSSIWNTPNSSSGGSGRHGSAGRSSSSIMGLPPANASSGTEADLTLLALARRSRSDSASRRALEYTAH